MQAVRGRRVENRDQQRPIDRGRSGMEPVHRRDIGNPKQLASTKLR